MDARLCKLAVLLACALGPLPALAGSCPSPPQGYGAAWWSSYKSWCRSCGGTISDTYNDAQANGGCRLSSSGSSSSSSSSAASTGAAIGQALGQAIVDGFKQAQEQARIRAEQARIEAARLQALWEQEEAERQRLFQANKSSLLSAAGVEGGLRLRDSRIEDAATAQRNWLLRLHQREMDLRQAALARLKDAPEEDWCKLNLIHVRLPTPPLNDVAGQYPGMVQRYLGHRDEWDRRCDGPSAQAGYRDGDRELLAQRPSMPRAPAAAPIPVEAGTVDLSAMPATATVANLKDGREAPVTPVSWGPPETVQLMLSSQAKPALPAAAQYIGSAIDYLKDKTREQIEETVGEAVAARLGMTGVVMMNAAKLPELILPNIEAASRGELSVGEADRLLPRAVNTLYNVGSLSNEALEAALAQPDAAQGLTQWGSDKARAAAIDTAAEQIGRVTGSEAAGSAVLMASEAARAAGLWTSRAAPEGAR
ncbi:MAG: hypothetical protein K0Q68_41 [Moraxellaceae bacterium]|jgi:hypothetical protein|nr:hypothetical protein [Moraxellaceae bacterium]